MSESIRKHRKWLECAAKWRNRRGNILILCPEVVQCGPTNWNEQNMHIGRGAAYHLLPTEILTVLSQPHDLEKRKQNKQTQDEKCGIKSKRSEL
jgi:hypothetical protein